MNTLVHVRAPQCKLVEAYHPYMHRTTGLFKLIAKIQQVFHVQAAFERYDPEFLRTCFVYPCRTITEWGFLFIWLARYSRCSIHFLGY